MSEPPLPIVDPLPPLPTPPPPAPPAAPYWTAGTLLAWLVILAAVVFLLLARALPDDGRGSSDDAASELQMKILARQAVGWHYVVHQLPGGQGDQLSSQLAPLLRQLEELADRPAQRVRLIPVIAQIRGAEAAVARARELDGDDPELQQDLELLRTIYRDDAPALLPQRQRDQLVERHGWYGQLALAWDAPPDSPARRAALLPAIRTAIGWFIAVIAGIGALVTGVVLLIVAIVLLVQGRLRRHRLPRVVHDRAFLQAFAIYLAWMIGIGLLRGAIGGDDDAGASGSVLTFWTLVAGLAPVACLWPLVRGVQFDELRLGLGWHRGAGWLRETGMGIVGYLAGLPLVLVGLIVTMYLSRFAGAQPTHPIAHEISAAPLRVIALLLLASVYAPLAEETMFRGAFYQGVRRPLGAILGIMVVSFIFAAVHPQGWTAIPALGCIAIVLNVMREWRGSIVAPVVAHAINNGALVILLVTLAG